MKKTIEGQRQTAAHEADAVGIVVQNGAHEQQRPRAVAFVWGSKVRPTPTLPYGRWKHSVPSAA